MGPEMPRPGKAAVQLVWSRLLGPSPVATPSELLPRNCSQSAPKDPAARTGIRNPAQSATEPRRRVAQRAWFCVRNATRRRMLSSPGHGRFTRANSPAVGVADSQLNLVILGPILCLLVLAKLEKNSILARLHRHGDPVLVEDRAA